MHRTTARNVPHSITDVSLSEWVVRVPRSCHREGAKRSDVKEAKEAKEAKKAKEALPGRSLYLHKAGQPLRVQSALK